VERVANDNDVLKALTTEYGKRLKASRFTTDSNWPEYVGHWIDGQQWLEK